MPPRCGGASSGTCCSSTFGVNSDAVLEVAQGTGLSAYDGEYVALAQEMNVPLVTTDGAILRAVPDVAVRPDEITASET